MAAAGPTPVSVSALWAHDADLETRIKEQEHHRKHARGLRLLLLAFSTLGVVYGDIGTSPLYVFGAVFPDGAPADENVVLGVFSTIFWTITAIVLVKYIIFTMSADDNGEGGIYALYALICRACNIRSGAARMSEADLSLTQYQQGRPPRGSRVAAALRNKLETSHGLQLALLLVVLLASNMIISDGVLTPAISVVSAIEGLQFKTGISRGVVIAVTCVILVLLFALQSVGTERVSFLFSPLMLLWFVANFALGIYNVSRFGGFGIMRALSPHYMYYYWSGDATEAWKNLGNIMLCVTGAEALYADMGHFNALSIRVSFLAVVYPSLLFTYLGQTAMIVQNPATSATAFWSSVPNPVVWPMVVLATLAAIIASQALITGAFSIVQQAMAMNAFPRLTIRHTSTHNMGQVYIPEVNWLLMIGAIIVVAAFKTSAKIGNAYGLAVITVMLLDTSLFVIVAITAWEWNLLAAGTFWLVFSFITGAYLSSNLEKIPKGAWFSLALSAVLSCITYLWHWGQHKKLDYVRANKILLRDLYENDPRAPAGKEGKQEGGGASVAASAWGGLLARPSATTVSSDSNVGRAAQPLQMLRMVNSHQPVARVPGVGIYYNELLLGVPPVLERFMSLVPALHEVVIFLTVRVVPVPNVLPQERLLLRRLRFQGFYHVVARYGYMDQVDHGEEFINSVVAEIHEYLHPATGIIDLSAEAAAAHEAAVSSIHAGRGPAAGVTAGGLDVGKTVSDDVEKGVPSREGSVRRGNLVYVDGTDSLSAITGRQMHSNLAVQLFNLGRTSAALQLSAAQGQGEGAARSEGGSREGSRHGGYRGSRSLPTKGSAPAGGPPNLARSSTITMAVPLVDEDSSAHGGDRAGASTAPWVQMPSQVRRVRARLLGLPEGEPLSPHSVASPSRRGSLPLTADQHSLPLPSKQQRPPLGPLLSRDSTKSLPLPRHKQQSQRVPLYRVQRILADEAAEAAEQQAEQQAASQQGQQAAAAAAAAGGRPPMSPPQATPTSTLTPAAAARLGQQLWQRLQQGRLLHRTSGDSRATGVSRAASDAVQQLGRQASQDPAVSLRSQDERRSVDGGVADTVMTEDVVGGAAAGGSPLDPDAARRQLFNLQSTKHVTESVLEDRYSAERQLLLAARRRGVVYVFGRSSLRTEPGSSWFKSLMLEKLYGTLVANSRPTTRMYQVPREGLLSIGVDYSL